MLLNSDIERSSLSLKQVFLLLSALLSPNLVVAADIALPSPPQRVYPSISPSETTGLEVWTAPADTKREIIYGLTSMSGSRDILLPSATWSGVDVGKQIAIAGIGPKRETLAATIEAVSVENEVAKITLSIPAGATLTNAHVFVVWGHDDATAINAAIARGITNVVLSGSNWGISQPINLPSDRPVHFHCHGATISALSPLTTMLRQEGGKGRYNFFATEGSVISDCRLDGMGLVEYNVDHAGFGWTIRDLALLNARTTNILCREGCENNYFSELTIVNDPGVTPRYPDFAVRAEYTDNHFTNIIASGASRAVFFDNSSGNYWIGDHGYDIISGPVFWFHGSTTQAIGDYADGIGPGQIGFRIDGFQVSLVGWVATVSGSFSNQIAVWISSASDGNTITAGRAQNFDPAGDNGVVQEGAETGAAKKTVVVGNSGASYVALGQTGSLCIGIQSRCFGARAVSVGAFAQANYGAIAIGQSAVARAPGSVALGAGAHDQGTMSMVYTATNMRSAQRGWAVLASTLDAAAEDTRLTADQNAPGEQNSLAVNENGSLSLSCEMTLHRDSDVAHFYMDGHAGSSPALFTRGSDNAIHLSAGGVWTAGPATVDAAAVQFVPSVAVDLVHNTPKIKVSRQKTRQNDGVWRAVARCDYTIAD